MFAVSFQEQRDVLREVLAVGVQGNGIGKTGLPCLAKAFLKRISFPLILFDNDKAGLFRQGCQPGRRIICATVQHHKNVLAEGLRPRHYIGHGPRIVECGDDNADSSLLEAYFAVFRHRSDILATGTSPAVKSVWALTASPSTFI